MQDFVGMTRTVPAKPNGTLHLLAAGSGDRALRLSLQLQPQQPALARVVLSAQGSQAKVRLVRNGPSHTLEADVQSVHKPGTRRTLSWAGKPSLIFVGPLRLRLLSPVRLDIQTPQLTVAVSQVGCVCAGGGGLGGLCAGVRECVWEGGGGGGGGRKLSMLLGTQACSRLCPTACRHGTCASALCLSESHHWPRGPGPHRLPRHAIPARPAGADQRAAGHQLHRRGSAGAGQGGELAPDECDSHDYLRVAVTRPASSVLQDTPATTISA